MKGWQKIWVMIILKYIELMIFAFKKYDNQDLLIANTLFNKN